MNSTNLALELETYKKKIRIMEHALSESAGVYYNINITRDLIPGTMYQVIDDVEYSINEAIGFPDDCRYLDVIEYWGSQLAEDQKAAYFEFFSLEHLRECFEKGNEHICHSYWTKDSLGNPMLAEQHIVMYRDLSNNDLLAITYVLDHTKIDELNTRNIEQKKILEEDIKKIEGLASQYSTVYFINFDTDQCSKYDIDKTYDNVSPEMDNVSTADFFRKYKELVMAYTHPDFRDELIRLTDEKHIREVLRDKKRHAFRFLNTGKNGDYQWL